MSCLANWAWGHDNGISRHAKPQNFSLSTGLSQTAAGIYVSTKRGTGTSLVVQWFFTLNARGPGSVPGQGSRSHVLQLSVSTLQLKIPDFPGGLVVKNTPHPSQCRNHRRLGFKPSVGKMPWKRKWQPSLVFSLG